MKIFVRSLDWLPFSKDPSGFAPYPGIMLLHRRTRGWRRHRRALEAHERVHWWQYLRTAPLGVIPLIALVWLGVLSPWWLFALPLAVALPLWILYLPFRDHWEEEAQKARYDILMGLRR